MNPKQVQEHLRWLGWDNVAVDGDLGPTTQQAVANFQAGFAYWDLAVDGVAGPDTQKALAHAVARRRQGHGTASDHFSFVEFQCKCGGRYKGCQRIKADRATVRGLEKYRASLGTGLAIISGYRCPSHNKAVGGASQSRHVAGDAADVQPVQSRTTTKRLGVFTGIGYQGSTGKTRHVDTRPGSVGAPTMWVY